MQIFIDADACPVMDIVETIAEKYNISTTLLCDTNHILYSDYSEVIVVGAGADAVDYKLISICHKGDVVVSQDYGVAAMALGKGAYAIHQSGKWYTNENIDQMLMERHLNKKARRSLDCQHFFRQIFLGYFSDIVQAFDTLRKNVCGDDYTSLHNPIVLSSVLPAYGMFHSIQILFL